jgi:Ca2+:H+ antiporter
VLTGALHYGGGPEVATFIIGAVALAGLAWVISFATEVVGEHFGPAVTGVLQATLGNLPELFVVLFAVSAGEIVVAQLSILGSLFANALLVLGLTIVVGARSAPDGVMRFSRRLPNDTATLLQLAVFIIVLLGLSNQVGDRASQHQVEISVIGAVLLLLVYAAWLVPYLRTPVPNGGREAPVGGPGLPLGVVLLAAAGVGAALVSEYFVDALGPAVDDLGISREFTGLVIVALAGNAVEHTVSITLAAKQKNDLAISVIKNSVSQIAVFLFPALVLLSLFFDPSLTFVVSPVYIGALALMALAVWQITGDGEAVTFEGLALVAFYAVLATLAWFE